MSFKNIFMKKKDAEAELLNRISAGRELKSIVGPPNVNAILLDDLGKFEIELAGWRELNAVVLETIFKDSDLLTKYSNLSNGLFHLTSDSTFDIYRGFCTELDKELGFLDTCIQRLRFYKEPDLDGQVFKSKQNFSAFLAVKRILEDARKSVLLVDGYVDSKTLAALSQKNKGVSVQILTSPKAINSALLAAADAFECEHGSIEIRTSKEFHDRFLVIDESSVHQAGCSIKDLGDSSATLLSLNSSSIRTTLISTIQTGWTKATVARPIE